MTVREWLAKRIDAMQEYAAEKEDGKTSLDWEAWRVTKGYIVTEKKKK